MGGYKVPTALLAVIFVSSSFASEQCQKWFNNSKIKQGPNCEFDCALKTNDMGNFYCSDECEELCKTPVKRQIMISLSELYPGLTSAERALAGQDPTKTLKAYKLSWSAESLCNGIYGKSRHNDESDACRHFVWAALMSHELGKEFAKKVLDAHEQDPEQPEEERTMDLSNNKIGIAAEERLTKSKNFSESSVIEDFKGQLKNNKLIVIQPRHPQGVKK